MALDRQRILSELGNVMNQLKSADCGCMNKLFGDSGQNVAPMECSQTYGGCTGGGCYGNSCGRNQNGSCGKGFHNNQQNMYPCMGTRCNPKMLYADTYGYLNQSLMQPTVKEVYDDLKSISPNNTIMNNPMAKQMGLSNEVSGQGGMQVPDQYQGGFNVSENMSNNAPSPANSNQTDQFGGMGPHIMNMLGGNIFKPSNTAPQNSNTANTGQLLEPMVIDAPQSTHGKVGLTPLSVPMSNPNAGQVYFSNQANTQSNMNHQNQTPGIQQSNFNSAHSQHQYGQNSQGIAKFNEMFPGVMKNDLGFDPMTIAIQMNPANQKQAAVDTMYKMLNNNKGMNRMPDNNIEPSPYGSMIGNNQVNSQSPKIQNAENAQELYQTPTSIAQGATVDNTGQLHTQDISPNQQMSNSNTVNNTSYGQPQQVYAALTNSPNSNQQQQLKQPIQFQQQEPLYGPSTGNINNPPTSPTVYEGTAQLAAELQQTSQTADVPNSQQMIKEPIFPADTSPYVPIRQKYYDYNTLGQPINRQSAKIYHTPEPPLPQTLSPQPATKHRNDFTKYSNVKATMSKISLIGNTVKKEPSRSQLQQIYNTYKGSHSYTQQNINDQANRGASNSDGKLQAVQHTNPQQIPIEKIGGDTAANNRMQDRRNKVEEVIGQIGDVPYTNKLNKPIPQEISNPVEMRKGRNGLQDMVYTSYPISSAWSFHGHNRAEPAGYRYR